MRTSSQGKAKAKEHKKKYLEKKGIKGIWKFHQVNVSKLKNLTDEQIEEAFIKQWKEFKEGKSAFQFPFGLSAYKTKKYNLVMDGLIDTIIARMIGTATGSQDLEARFMAIGTGNETPAATQTELDQEYYRAAFTEASQVDNAASFVCFFNRTTANGFTTDAVTDVGNTTTKFLVDPTDAAQFQIGNLIRVTTTSQFNFTSITDIDISANTITVSPPLADIPLTGDQVVQAWAEAGVFGNSDASITANTGTMFNRVNDLNFVKDDQNIILIEVQFIFTAV